ncbi:ABC transporter permease [Streptomyces sp. NPDC005811]|uniref:ABC transporter permease n=1 Tax=Streptomyces sp. NPDC005811 TaxID=3154565 RepID=UPI0033E4DB98
MTPTAASAALANGTRTRDAHGKPVFSRSTFLVPVLCAFALTLLYLVVRGRSVDVVEANMLRWSTLRHAVIEHIYISVVIAALVLLIAVPLGVLVTRRRTRWMAPFVLALGNLGQSAPSLGLLALFGSYLFIGFWAVVIILTAYTTLSVLRNTIVGLQGIDPSVLDAARGMGMSPARILLGVELPLAVPIIGAGTRTAIVLAVATVPLGSFLGAGGLGATLFGAVRSDRPFAVLVASVMIAVLALLMDWAAGIIQRCLTPRGIR